MLNISNALVAMAYRLCQSCASTWGRTLWRHWHCHTALAGGSLWFKVKHFVKLVVTLSNIGFIRFQGETFREVVTLSNTGFIGFQGETFREVVTLSNIGFIGFQGETFREVVTLSNIGFIGFQGETFREVLHEGTTFTTSPIIIFYFNSLNSSVSLRDSH